MRQTNGKLGTVTAAVAAAMAFGLLNAPPLDAGDDAAGKDEKARLAAVTPETVRTQGRLVKDPLSPSGWSAEIEVNNPVGEEVGLDVEVRVAESQGGGMSRMPAMAVVKFHKKAHLDLLAGAQVKQRVPIPKGTLSQKGGKVLRPVTVRVAVERLRRADGTMVAAKVRPDRAGQPVFLGPDSDFEGALGEPPAPQAANQAPMVAKRAE
ncbi:MAG: hypothetical protein HY902_00700 [Deltaproteobacteria bacterium]|nr:hypothetical protein [Deltaproteobacteria bacterium]